MPQDPNWIDLYEYVKKDIMGYPVDFKLPRYMVLRLKGLSSGQFLANKKTKPMASYDFKTILYTFKINRPSILQGFASNSGSFKNEQHKFNYALVIIESNINDVVIRLNNAKKTESKTANMDLENQIHSGAEYKTKSRNADKKLEDLW